MVSKDITKYVELHEAGESIETIRTEMIEDGISLSNTTHFIKKVLKESKNVIKVSDKQFSDEQVLELNYIAFKHKLPILKVKELVKLPKGMTRKEFRERYDNVNSDLWKIYEIIQRNKLFQTVEG